MTVKELIDVLKKFDQDKEVEIKMMNILVYHDKQKQEYDSRTIFEDSGVILYGENKEKATLVGVYNHIFTKEN